MPPLHTSAREARRAGWLWGWQVGGTPQGIVDASFSPWTSGVPNQGDGVRFRPAWQEGARAGTDAHQAFLEAVDDGHAGLRGPESMPTAEEAHEAIVGRGLTPVQLARSLRSDPQSVTILRYEPVGATEIADRLGVGLDAVKKWRQRPTGFPAPRGEVGGRPAWDWADIERWAAETGRLEE